MRRNCTQCGAWRHLVFYMAWAWKEDGTPTAVMGHCESCQRERRRKLHHSRSEAQKNKARATARAMKRRQRRKKGVPEVGARVKTAKRNDLVLVDRVPIANWLRDKIRLYGIKYVAIRLNMNERQLFTIVNGYYIGKRRGRRAEARWKKGIRSHPTKLRAVDWVTLETVDRILVAWGATHELEHLYPSK